MGNECQPELKTCWRPPELFGVFTALTILTEMFTRQVPQNLKSETVKITYTRKSSDLIVGHSDGKLGKQVTTSRRHTKLLEKMGKMSDPKIGRI